MTVKVKGINTIRNRRSGKIYHYCRQTGTRLPSPDSPEFLETLVAVRAKAEEVKRAAQNDCHPDNRKTFSALIGKYRDSDYYSDLAPGTKKEYDRHLKALGSILGIYQVSALNRGHGRKIMTATKDTPSVGKARKRVLSVLLSFAMDELRWISSNPVFGLERRRRRKKKEDARGDRIESGNRPLEEHEIRKIRKNTPVGTRERALFEALLATGFRRSDVRRLPASLDTDDHVVLCTNKTGSLVVVAVTEELRNAVSAWNARRAENGHSPSDYLISSEKGTPLHKRTVSKHISDLFQAAGLRHLGAHALRYTAAVRLHEAGLHYDDIAEHLGHAAASMAKHYCDKRRNATARAKILDSYDQASMTGA